MIPLEQKFHCPEDGDILEKDLFYIDSIRYCPFCGSEVSIQKLKAKTKVKLLKAKAKV